MIMSLIYTKSENAETQLNMHALVEMTDSRVVTAGSLNDMKCTVMIWGS